MKLPIKLLLIFFLTTNYLSAQDSIVIEKKDRPRYFIGIDLAQPAMQFFTDKKGYEAVFSAPLYKRWQLAVEAGYERNLFDDSRWKGEASGFFARGGANWIVGKDDINPNMNFYLGGRVGYTRFSQNIKEFLIQGYGVPNVKGSLPPSNANALWLEPLVGGRVPIRESNFYIDANARILLLLFHNGGDDITPIAIPGFGKNNNGFNLRVIWAIGYAF